MVKAGVAFIKLEIAEEDELYLPDGVRAPRLGKRSPEKFGGERLKLI
jgi:hypothetical protein